MTIQSHSDLGAKCIDVPYAQFLRGMRLQMWACNNILVWGLQHGGYARRRPQTGGWEIAVEPARQQPKDLPRRFSPMTRRASR